MEFEQWRPTVLYVEAISIVVGKATTKHRKFLEEIKEKHFTMQELQGMALEHDCKLAEKTLREVRDSDNRHYNVLRLTDQDGNDIKITMDTDLESIRVGMISTVRTKLT